jgi:hypothetical protein
LTTQVNNRTYNNLSTRELVAMNERMVSLLSRPSRKRNMPAIFAAEDE